MKTIARCNEQTANPKQCIFLDNLQQVQAFSKFHIRPVGESHQSEILHDQHYRCWCVFGIHKQTKLSMPIGDFASYNTANQFLNFCITYESQSINN